MAVIFRSISSRQDAKNAQRLKTGRWWRDMAKVAVARKVDVLL